MNPYSTDTLSISVDNNITFYDQSENCISSCGSVSHKRLQNMKISKLTDDNFSVPTKLVLSENTFDFFIGYEDGLV